jgi:hypothetical protein
MEPKNPVSYHAHDVVSINQCNLSSDFSDNDCGDVDEMIVVSSNKKNSLQST